LVEAFAAKDGGERVGGTAWVLYALRRFNKDAALRFPRLYGAAVRRASADASALLYGAGKRWS
jgi:hypothetical protein